MNQRCQALTIQLLIVVLVAAACSGHGSSATSTATGPRLTAKQYSLALELLATGPTVERADREFTTLAAGAVTPAQCKAGARQFSDDVAATIAQAEKLNPPANVAQLQQRFIAAATTSSEAIAQAADDVESGDLKCGEPWNHRVYGLESTDRAVAALAGMAAQGILFSGNNSH